ncbi:MAG: tRNA (adenosine(37)-N6)-threonylcarbamoyltransferase complex dimerization subunit type 1 TsaB [Alphaproteobacteria bacterium]|nr:tRNA (adenosine(37)-N6)-threonylcarbamoyltransferase complex dimerization subunit type 1 TsaB [Alphaproteobacteria bacterium]
MLILTLDTCSSLCGAGVWQDGRWLSRAQERMERGQDARLMPLVFAAMQEARRDFADLDRVAVLRGPGSFTGVRVCLAAAIGIGLAAGKPVIGVDRFSVYKSLYATQGRNLLVVIESKRAELFCKFYPAQGTEQEACMMTSNEIDAFIAANPDTAIVGDFATPEADALFACAELAAQADPKDPAFHPRPLYLRAPDVTVARIPA